MCVNSKTSTFILKHLKHGLATQTGIHILVWELILTYRIDICLHCVNCNWCSKQFVISTWKLYLEGGSRLRLKTYHFLMFKAPAEAHKDVTRNSRVWEVIGHYEGVKSLDKWQHLLWFFHYVLFGKTPSNHSARPLTTPMISNTINFIFLHLGYQGCAFWQVGHCRKTIILSTPPYHRLKCSSVHHCSPFNQHYRVF